MADETAPPQKIEYTAPDAGLFQTYSNNVAIAASPFDVRLFFGEMIEGNAERLIVEQRVKIVMTWLETKILALFLIQYVNAYEKANGELVIPSAPTTVEPPTVKRHSPTPES